MYHNNFNKERKSMVRNTIGLGIVNVILKLGFWVGLFFGIMWVLNHFGMLSKLMGLF